MYQQSQRSLATGISTPALLGQVLGIVSVGFAITALFSYLSGALGLPYGVSLVASLAGLGFVLAINLTRANSGLSAFLFYAFTACEGLGIGPLVSSYARIDGPGVVVNAAATTAMGMATLACVAFLTSFDFRRFQGVAFGLLLALVVVSLISAFTHFIHPTVIAWATLGIFTLITLIDFSRLRAGGNGLSAVQMATSIYLDAINIFLALLRIFGSRSRDD